MRRLFALMRKEFTHMKRDPRTLMAVFFMPILQLLLLGYATNTDVKNVPTAVYDQDNSQASRALLEAYRQTGYFQMDYIAQRRRHQHADRRGAGAGGHHHSTRVWHRNCRGAEGGSGRVN